MFHKAIFKDSKYVKRIRNYASICSLYLYFLIKQNSLISFEKVLMSAELKGCATWFIYFLDLLTESSFIIAGYVWQILGRAKKDPPSVSSPEMPILSRVKESFVQNSCVITLHLIFWKVLTIYDINLWWNYESQVKRSLWVKARPETSWVWLKFSCKPSEKGTWK